MKNQDAFLAGFTEMKIPVLDSDGNSAWPEMFPIERIETLRDVVGPRHFASQMMLNPEPLTRARLDPSAIVFYDDELDMRAAKLGETKLTGWGFYWDPSAARKRNDASVCVLILRDDRTRRAFIHECLYLYADDDDAHPLATQCGEILDFMERYEIKNIAIEVNGIGNAIPEIMRREAENSGREIFVQRVVNKENKAERILGAIEPLLSAGRLFAHKRVKSSALFDEFSDWTPNGWTRDDGLDALAGALRLTPLPLRPRQRPARPFKARTEFAI